LSDRFDFHFRIVKPAVNHCTREAAADFVPELNLTDAPSRLSFEDKIMADIPPIPPTPGMPMGAEPMKKSTGKVQPKKETVRINLPPKPSAAPTIKLPTLPPGGPTGASSASPIQPPTGAPALRSSAAPRAAGAAVPAPQTRPAPAQRAAPVAVVAISTLDKILAIAACVTALAAVGTTVWMMMLLNAALSQ
jgi:hypothetical protein